MDRFTNAKVFKIRPQNLTSFAALALLFGSLLIVRAPAQNLSFTQEPAANAAASNNAPAAASPAATPIPLSDVTAQAENAAATLKEIGAGASIDPVTAAAERDLPALTEEINARLEETATTVAGSTSLDDLRSFETDWRRLAGNLPVWEKDLTARARKLESDLQRVGELTERWQKTLESLKSAEAPPEVLARVEEIIRTAAATRAAVVAELSRVARLQNRVAEQQNRVAEALRTISAKRDALVGQLLVRDAPPVWSADLWTKGDVGRGLRDSLATQIEGLNAFAARNKDKLIVHILVFAALAGALFYLRGKARPLVAEYPGLKQAAVIFNLPIATALLLAIVFSSSIYPQTPQILRALFGAVALVPTVVILRESLERALYPLLYALVLFFFVDQLRAIFDGVPAFVRPLLMAETVAAFLFFRWFYRARLARQSETEDVRANRVHRVVRAVSRIVQPFFVVAFLANFFGYVNLSRLVGDGVLRSLYAALVLYAAVRIIDGLIAFALRFRPLNRLKMVRDSGALIEAKTQKFVRVAALVLWIVIALDYFTLREYVFGNLRALLTAELVLGSLSVSAADVLLFALVVWAAFALSRFVRFALEEDVYPRFALAQGVPYAVSTIVNYLILLLGFFFAVGAAGLDLTRLTVLVGAFGVGIGFGLQNIFNNFVSGLILLFERPVKVGDEIKIGEESGTVRQIGIRASLIRQWDNSEVIVPNSKLISENVKNWSFSSRKRGIEIPVSVAREADTEKVAELLRQAAAEHPLVAEKPAPQVILNALAAPTLNFRLRAWTTKTDQTLAISGELTTAVNRKLIENGIELTPAAAPPAG